MRSRPRLLGTTIACYAKPCLLVVDTFGTFYPRLAHLAPGLDPSWQALLTEQFLHHSQVGKDTVFTYGPWGMLGEPRGNLAIYPWLVFGRLVLAAGLSLGLAWLTAVYRLRSTILEVACLLVILALANPILLVPFTLFCVLFESPDRPDWRRTLAIAFLIPACALAAHVKNDGLSIARPAGLAPLVPRDFRSKARAIPISHFGRLLFFSFMSELRNGSIRIGPTSPALRPWRRLTVSECSSPAAPRRS